MSERTISFLVTTAFPNAYFLDQGLWQASADYRHLNSLRSVGDVQDPKRVRDRVWDAINNSWRRHNENLARQDPPRVDSAADFVLLHYDRALVSPGYDTFVCPLRECERIFTRDEVEKSNYRCIVHKNQSVSQLAHLFVHADCGSIQQIGPRKCWNHIGDKQCKEPLRLHLEYQQMGKSYWWCPKCRYERHLPEKGDDHNLGWNLGQLRAWCSTCSVEGQPKVMMRLTTARKIFQPQRVDVVDMAGADAQNLLQEWFGKTIDEDKILKALPPELQTAFQADPRIRRTILQSYQSRKIGDEAIPELPRDAQEELANYAGALSTVSQTSFNLSKQVHYDLDNEFGMKVSLLDGLAIVRATYGYLVGGSSPDEATLQVFPMGGVRYAVLTQRLPTEALLFELLPDRVLVWLHQRGMAKEIQDLIALRRYLISCKPEDEILKNLTGLVHTAAHGLRRSSERYTGMGRDLTDELLIPRGLSFVIYNNRGSELGMFTTTFEGRLLDWFYGTRFDISNCPFDPICMNEPHPACPGCLYIGERGCTTLWNRNLDRRHLVQLPTSKEPGYWL
jgi:hypothetical protein